MSEKVTQSEYDTAIKAIESKFHYRFTAGVDDNSAFFVPVSADGEHVVGDCFQLSWSKIKKLAALCPPEGVK